MEIEASKIVEVQLDKIVGGGQALGTLAGGKKVFVWGGLPGELVRVQITREKSHFCEAVVVDILEPSLDRVEPLDGLSCLATSPWQIMSFEAEQRFKRELLRQAYELNKVELPEGTTIYSDDVQYGYRNKVEYRFVETAGQLSLAFLERASKTKLPLTETHLAKPEITAASRAVLGVLSDLQIASDQLAGLLIRSDDAKKVVWRLSVRDGRFPHRQFSERLPADLKNGHIVLASKKFDTKPRELSRTGSLELSDKLLGQNFSYCVDGFFQINLPVYERALTDIRKFTSENDSLADLFSGVGSIGLSCPARRLVLVESDIASSRSAAQNIVNLSRQNATAVTAPADDVLADISSDLVVIVDPPRAGLGKKLVAGLAEKRPRKVIYLSCNPVTQARDIAALGSSYKMVFARAYNFFPRTPHIENLLVLESI